MGAVPRPLGVTILAILGFIATIFFLAVAGILFIAATLAATILASAFGPFGTFLAAIGVIAGVIVLIIALIEGLLSWGLWAGKNWARIIVTIFYVLGLLGALGSIAAGLYLQVIPLIIYILLIYYLTRPNVAAYFHRASMQPMQPQMQQPPQK